MIKNILCLVVIALLFSCNKDDATIVAENQESSVDDIKVENGILSFSNKDFLKETVDGLKRMNTDEKELNLEKYYKKGFMPLYPHFKENDVDLLQRFSRRKRDKLEKQKAFKTASFKSNYSKGVPTEIDEDGELVEEFDDDLISDDEFASFLNDEREIIIGDSLYKFTYSGMFSVKKDEKIILDKYILDNNIKYLEPDASIIPRGVTEPVEGIIQSVPTIQSIQEPMILCEERYLKKGSSSKTAILEAPLLKELSCAPVEEPYKSPTTPTVVDHTASLQVYMNTLGACNTINGFLDSGFGIFGTSKKCYSNFSSKYRTKTKFWKEKYLVYNSIGIKVKHQKKGWTGLWRAKSTDEVGLAIKLATFSYDIPIPNFPASYQPKKLYFFEDKIFDSEARAVSYRNAIYKPGKPDIPFLNDVTVTEWINDRFGYEITVEEARNLFYTGAWAGAKAIVKSERGKEVKRVVHIIYTPTKVIVTYADLENRKLNEKKIVNRFDFNFGIGFKFTVDVNSNGQYNTNINGWGDIPGHIQIPKLYDYKKIEIDFVGVSRKGNVWKGSNLKYIDK